MSETEYIPFGEEWEKEMMKLSKKQLIGMYRMNLRRNKSTPSPALQDAVKEIAFPSESDVESYLATLPYYGACTTEYNEGFEDGVKWTREKCINELNS